MKNEGFKLEEDNIGIVTHALQFTFHNDKTLSKQTKKEILKLFHEME